MDKIVTLSWAMDRSVIGCNSAADWWWKELVLCIHHGEPVTLGFVCDCGHCYAMYLGTDVLLYRPTIAEVEQILAVFHANNAREAQSHG